MRSPADLLYNFHWIVAGTAARSAQAYGGFLGPFLKSHHIKCLINLRGPNPRHIWWNYETWVCRRIGADHRDVMLNSRRLPTRQMLLNLLVAFDHAPIPFLLKCSGGQDRTSFAAALYLIHTRGWNAFRDAEAQFARWPYLHLPKKHQRWLKPFISFAKEAAAGRPLAEWVRDEYSPALLKEWLESRGLGDAFRGLYTVPGSAPGI